MFDAVTLSGREGTVVWGYHTAAVCTSWRVAKTEGGAWSLSASLSRADAFKLRQAPLKFTAPRVGGFFCWPIVHVTLGAGTLAAALGPPES